MLLKWIVCDVAPADRAAFGEGQRQWAALAGCPGFGGQSGGWSTDGRACIAGLWADRAAYAAFMAGPHDPIAARAAQAPRIARIRVTLFEAVDLIGPGPLGQTGHLRVAECRVRAERRERFRAAQRDVWSPGMAACPGFVGGLFAEGLDGRFVVLTRWRDAETHARYRAEAFPGLRDRARPDDDLLELTGREVSLHARWSVPPT